jgi:precorrin-2 dehydrogenase
MSLFPMFVKLEKKKCVVVGAGRIAAAKARGLLRNGARVVVVAPRATDWIRSQARAYTLIWRRREFAATDINGAFLVVAATDSVSTNEAVFQACTKRRIVCNVVDDPDRCDFFYPAVVRRGPLQIAISTEGRSPALARRLRIELAKQFGPEYRTWVEHVGTRRKEILRRQMPKREKRRLMDQIAGQESLKQWREARPAGPVRPTLNQQKRKRVTG